ncbi:MAG TPA: hypothetical protein VIV40_06880 [Kofleriaceae bacterium]
MTKLLAIVTTALLATACRDRVDRDDRPRYSKTSQTADDDFAHTRTTYSRQINDRLQKLDERIHELAAKGTVKAREAADRLRAERDRLAPKVDEVGHQAKEGWDRFESEVSRGFDKLEHELDAAFENN